MALVDGNRLLTVLALVMPLCQFLTLPLVGLLSDAYGRKLLGTQLRTKQDAKMFIYFSEQLSLFARETREAVV